MLIKRSHILKIILALLVGILAWLLITSPSHDRTWTKEHERMTTAEVKNTYTVTLHNVRNFEHSTDSSTALWEERELDLSELSTLDYIVVPFSGFGTAHTMLSFGFEDGQHIGVSIEARREEDESFSPLWGALRKYELIYILADERDLLGQRAVRRDNDTIYLYPANASRDQIRHLFIDILARANTLNTVPEFYNTLISTCTTNIMHHVNAIAPGSVPWWDLRLYLPQYSDTLAQKLGFIPNNVSIDSLRDEHEVSERIKEHIDSPRFSPLIRQTD